MLRKLLIQSFTILGLTSTAIANDFYFGVSATDTKYKNVLIDTDDRGHAVTFGVNLDILSGINTALELSYGDLIDLGFFGIGMSAETVDVSILASFGSGKIRPFGRLGISDGEVREKVGFFIASDDDTTEIWGLGADWIVSDTSFIRVEMTDAEYERTELETIRLGVFTRF